MTGHGKGRTFVRYLSHRDLADVEIVLGRGQVQEFTVNYRTRHQGTWHEVLRYDTCHGVPHLHRFWRGPDDEITNLDPTRPYRVLLEWALHDVEENWRAYRGRWLRTRRGGR